MRIEREYDKKEIMDNGYDKVAEFLFEVLKEMGVSLYTHTDDVSNTVRLVAYGGRKDDDTPQYAENQ